MGRKRMPGLYKRYGVFQIDKVFRGTRIRESTGTSDFAEAEAHLVRRIEQIRQAQVFGVRPQRSFKKAATKYLEENLHKRSIATDAKCIKKVMSYIGHLPLESVHQRTLQPFIDASKAKGLKSKSINIALGIVRRILNLAATEWRDENDLTWLSTAPKVRMLRVTDAREPYPLSWNEQARLLKELPVHLARMALFKVNTGLRDAEVCALRWEWQVAIAELSISVFIIPKEWTKNGRDRLVVLNSVARSVLKEVRGEHPQFVFVYKGHPIRTMNTSAWQKARKRAGLADVHVHDLRHTIGRRLRSAGVSFEDRQDLLSHKSGRMTTHYSMAEVKNLIEAAESIVESRESPVLVLLKKRVG
jgi:integrase